MPREDSPGADGATAPTARLWFAFGRGKCKDALPANSAQIAFNRHNGIAARLANRQTRRLHEGFPANAPMRRKQERENIVGERARR